jgi:signal transduction histidine kinase/ligand-binding sensor domain-containing protein/DNA-binding response OmpR family regulator
MKKAALFLFFVLLISTAVRAQEFEFSHLNNTNGLSNNQVECIFKDSRGFLWIGTNMGLNRYDGTNFKIYKNIPNDNRSPLFDRIMDIQEDIDGNLWVQSSAYMIYDRKNECFINNIDSVLESMGLPANPVMIEIDRDKNIYAVSINKGIYKYNIQTKQVTLYPQSENNNDFGLSDIVDVKIQGHFIWALHKNGILERLNTETGMVDVRNTFFKDNSQNATIQKSIFIDSDNDVWVYPGINDKGTAFLNLKQFHWTLLDNDKNKPALSSSFVRGIGQDSKGLIWIGTDHGGLNVFDKKKNAIAVIQNDIYNPNSLCQNSIISLFCEDNGTVWAGSYKNGISYYNPNMFKFKKSPLYYVFKQNAEVFDCNSFFKDKNNNLWIGANGQGLIKYNPQSGEIKRFKHDPQNPGSISSDIITAILGDHRQRLWVGTFLGGLNEYDGKTFRRYQLEENNPHSLSNKSVYGISEDNENNLWIATLGGGIDELDSERKTFTHHNTANSQLLSDYILSVFTDPVKNIYFSTDKGSYFVNRKSGVVTPYFSEQKYVDSLTTISINYQIVDSRGLLWIATDKGINIYNPFNKHFKYITNNDGLPSNEVVSLAEDREGNIWAGTRNGLACIYCKYTDLVLNCTIAFFDEKDGLPGSVCNPNAIFKDEDDIIYVGTTAGYLNFDPDKIYFNQKPPVPRFTDLLITNQIIKPNVKYKGRVIITQSIGDLDAIYLKHGETNFTVQFSALNLIHPEKNKYKYKLEGLDNQWTEITTGKGAASYSNLNSGTYRLIVYAGNSDNVWSDKPIVLEIHVAPPFWLSWWAFVIYVIIVAALIRGFVKYKLNKQKREYEQAQKIAEANKLHEIDELKFKFFTNISHEFKTPLTLIISPLEKLMRSPTYTENQSTLDIMYKNANNLLDMVNEILDFRKLEVSKMPLNLSVGSIIEFTSNICRSFSSLAAEKSIQLTFTTYLQDLQMEFDHEKMSKIITNLISNAFKYTEEGSIDVSIGISEQIQTGDSSAKQMILKVSDTGIGIASGLLDKIFERFFRIENTGFHSQPAGTGIGLHLVSEYVKLHSGKISVESTVGKGSVFTVQIPVRNSTLKELKNQDIIHSGSSFSEQMEITLKTVQNANLPLLLLVDDNEDFCDFITGLFVDDYRIETANDGEEGIAVVLDQLPDIILCDVMMPKMDGYEFCRIIKNDIRTSHIPIILLTAKSSEENRYSGIEAGADDYISKPFNIDMLKLKIAKIIEKQKKLQNHFKKIITVSPSDVEITSMDELFVQKSIAIVEKNMHNPNFLVEDLCKEMGMSRVYFYKKILALTNKTPSEFIRFIRLKRAADLLEKSQKFINEIAFEVGFNDPKYFRKYFKNEFGITPNEYKRK